MYNIGICDDNKEIGSSVEKLLLNLSSKYSIEIETSIFYDGSSLVKYITNSNFFDIIYLDIEMNIMDGISAAKEIRKMDTQVLIIYITNYESFAKDVFEVSAYRFLTKPINSNLFEKYFLNAIEYFQSGKTFFECKFNKSLYKLRISEIIYFQSDKRVTYIITKHEVHKCYKKLIDIEYYLTQKSIFFYRIRQSFLVNPEYVKMYNYTEMELEDGSILTISEKRRKGINELYCKLEGRKLFG